MLVKLALRMTGLIYPSLIPRKGMTQPFAVIPGDA